MGDRTPRSGFGPALLAAAAATFTPAVLFLSIPSHVIQANRADAVASPTLCRYLVAAFVLSWFVCLPAFLSAPHRRLADRVSRSVLWYGALVVAADATRTHLGLVGSGLGAALLLDVVAGAVLAGFAFGLRREPLYVILGASGVVSLLVASSGPLTEDPWTRGGPRPVVGVPVQELLAGGVEEVPGALSFERHQIWNAEAELEPLGEGFRLVTSASRRNQVGLPLEEGGPFEQPGLVRLRVRIPRGRIRFKLWRFTSERWGTDPRRETVDELVLGVSPGGADVVQEAYLRVPKGVPLRGVTLGNAFLGEDGVSEVEVLGTALLVRDPSVPADPVGPDVPGNVYHVILDGFQDELFQELTTREREERFGGFTHFPGFATNSWATFWSLAFLARGRPYQGRLRFLDWEIDAAKYGFWDDLVDAGIGVYSYPHFPYFCHPGGMRCAPHHELQERWRERQRSGEVEKGEGPEPTGLSGQDGILVDLTFLNLVPRGIAGLLHRYLGDQEVDHHSWSYGFSVTRTLAGLLERDGVEVEEARVLPNHFPYWSVRNFERMLEEESRRPPRGQYVFVHMIPPHAPWIFDEECGYLGDRPQGPEEGRYSRLFSTARCSLSLVERLLERLEYLGRLEDALVVVHADHGQFDVGDLAALPSIRERMGPRWTGTAPDRHKADTPVTEVHTDVVESYSSGLLLVKFPGQPDFRRSDRAVDLFDLAPTVLRHFGLDTSEYPGDALQAPAGSRTLPVTFYATEPWKVDTAPEFLEAFELRGERWYREGRVETRK